MSNKNIQSLEDVKRFERSLVELFWKQIKAAMPVTIEDSRQTDPAEEAAREQQISLEAFQALHGFNPNNKEEVLNQYNQAKIKRVTYSLPPVIFSQSSKSPLGVNYLKVRVTAHQTNDSELQHLLTDKTLSKLKNKNANVKY